MDKTIIIAETSWNHLGNMKLAKEMIDAAHLAGADYVKFQTWSVSRLKPGEWDKDGRREIYEKAELTKKRHIELIQYCKQVGIKFLSSAFSIKDAELLKKLKLDAIKIPSFESRNLELIEYCNKNFKTVFMSVGTSTLEEISNSMRDVSIAKWYLMHCVSIYPCSELNANLPKMLKLKRLFSWKGKLVGEYAKKFTKAGRIKIGYSDHTLGVEVAKVAVCKGAKVIEKHFTTNRDLEGKDNKFSIEPDELADLVKFVETYDACMIDHGDGWQEGERDARENYTGKYNG